MEGRIPCIYDILYIKKKKNNKKVMTAKIYFGPACLKDAL